MEKDLVILSIENYNTLLHCNYETSFKLNEHQCRYERLHKKHVEMINFAIKKCIIEYRIKTNTLDELLNFGSITSAIGIDDYKELTKLGVEDWQIANVVMEMKKEEQDGNK